MPRLGSVEYHPEDSNPSGEKHFLKVTFHNKGIEMVNLSSIVHSKKVRSTLPDLIEDKEPPVISYKYTKTIGHSIFNFRKVAREHEVDRASGNGCNCIHAPFLYEPLGHVITGDLRIITNKTLRELISKGPNFRKQNNINWDLCQKFCFEGIATYKKQWASREKVALSTLDEWACTVKTMVDNRITKLKGQPQKTRKRQILRTAACVKNLEELHEKYVLVPADKAGNNVIVVHKQYYKEVLTKELTNNSGASTYVRCNELADKVVESHLQFV